MQLHFLSTTLVRMQSLPKKLENGGQKELCWLLNKAYSVQLNKWVDYIGSCLIYGATAFA